MAKEMLFTEEGRTIIKNLIFFLCLKFGEEKSITVKRTRLEKFIRRELNAQEMGDLTRLFKAVGIEITSEVEVTHPKNERLTFTVIEQNTEIQKSLREEWERIKSGDGIIIA